MIAPGRASKALKDDLVKQVKVLETDLRAQIEEMPDLYERFHREYLSAFDIGRTAITWASWRDERVTQIAVAWVLGTVFVRFAEDNGLLAQPYITGPDVDRMMLAEEAQEEYFSANPAQTDRDWLLTAFAEIAASQAGRLLFNKRHNPLYQIPISHDAAKALIAFWRHRSEDGGLVHSLESDDWDTRFLGDLYQDLSESARKTYALLQTPEFVEGFILDYTLTPALRDFGHEGLRVIDPTCGSGHFVLDAFHRILAEWNAHEHTMDRKEKVRRALESVHGVDINPFAVAIARFRLFIAAIRAAGFRTLAEVSQNALPLNVAIGDSLIKHRPEFIPGINDDKALANFRYSTEDINTFTGILREGSYHVVVGNPPYVTVKDKALNGEYRGLYDACSGSFALSIPFLQRCFELAIPGREDSISAGYVGQITANSFMKREFGKKLIEQFLRDKVELTHIIDTSGAYIPGHGTPTAILVGQNRDYRLSRQPTIRVALGKQGEPVPPTDPSDGLVWKAITSQIQVVDSESEWISVADAPRDRFSTHPWSLSGGGASELTARISILAKSSLKGMTKTGISSTTGDDSAFLVPPSTRHRFPRLQVRRMVEGEDIRDYAIYGDTHAIWPYDDQLKRTSLSSDLNKALWPNRRRLERRKLFSVPVEEISRLAWYDFREIYKDKLLAKSLIAFSTIATHVQFAFCRNSHVYNRHALVIKLNSEAPDSKHLELLGVLNSSTACFWLKQVSQSKGNGGIGGGISDELWEHRYEFTGTKLQEFPLAARLPLARGRLLDELAQQLAKASPSHLIGVPSHESLVTAEKQWHVVRGQMIAAQEELDWEVYALYGLTDEELTAPVSVVPELRLGERAFEIVLARKMAAAGKAETQWFVRHGSTAITELPERWPDEYRAVVERRIALIEGDRNIGLLERPENKRRWATEGFGAMRERALREWLLDRCEARELWFDGSSGAEQPQLLTTVQLADLLRRDPDVLGVAELYAPGRELERVVAELVAEEHVPYLAALRYKDSGLGKRADWESVWEQQRAEDAAESEELKKKVRDRIPVPPKYGSGDFLKTSYWRNRGKLDVPKERFISYPHAGRDGATTAKDGALLLGWAGFDHEQQARVLARLIVTRANDDGWAADRLTPMLAGLGEVLPWVRQWHTEYDYELNGLPGEVYGGFLTQWSARLNLTEADLTSWRPPAATPRRRKR